MLGPEVCMKCIRFFDYSMVDGWSCYKCNSESSPYYAFTVSEEILQECIRKQKEEDEQPDQPHPATCGWHKDWHDCSCGAFDKEEESK